MWSSLPTVLLSTAFIYTMSQDLFTSVARLRPLISTEEKLIKAAEEYVQNEESRLQNVKRLVSNCSPYRYQIFNNPMNILNAVPIYSHSYGSLLSIDTKICIYDPLGLCIGIF